MNYTDVEFLKQLAPIGMMVVAASWVVVRVVKTYGAIKSWAAGISVDATAEVIRAALETHQQWEEERVTSKISTAIQAHEEGETKKVHSRVANILENHEMRLEKLEEKGKRAKKRGS